MKTIEEAAIDHVKSANGFVSKDISFKEGVAFAQRWISVKDELPEKMQWVIAMKHNGLKLGLYYNNKGDFVFGQLDQTRQVTHWRPIELK